MKHKTLKIIFSLFLIGFLGIACDKKDDEKKFNSNVNDDDATAVRTSNILHKASYKNEKKLNLAVYDKTNVGVKNFDQINVTMSRVTGVSTNNNNVKNVFNSVKTSLPSKNNYALFTGSMQVSVVKLASEYCQVAFGDQNLRNTILGEINGLWDQNLQTAFNQENRSKIMNQFAAAFWGHPANYAKGVDTNRFVGEMYDELINGRADNQGETRRLLRATCILYLSAAPVIIL